MDGFHSLHSLDLNSESLKIHDFCTAIHHFHLRLRNLKFTHFRDALNDSTKSVLFKALGRLDRLETLTMDWEMTNHRDGLDVADVSLLLESCAKLKSWTYCVPLDAYFEDHGSLDEQSRNAEKDLPPPLPDSHNRVGITLLSDSHSRSFPTLMLRQQVHRTHDALPVGSTPEERSFFGILQSISNLPLANSLSIRLIWSL